MICLDTSKSGLYITKHNRLQVIPAFYDKKSRWYCRYNHMDGSKLVRIKEKEFINLTNKSLLDALQVH